MLCQRKRYMLFYTCLAFFQNNKSYPVIRMSYYAIKCFNDFFTGGRELECHFITKVFEGIKLLSGYTAENRKSLLSCSDLKRTFQYLGGIQMNLTNSRLVILVLSFMGFLRFSELSNFT